MATKFIIDCDTGSTKVETMSSEEVSKLARPASEKAHAIRESRTSRLAETDWTQAADIPADTKSKWTAYRQNLRDIPTQSGFPNSVTWPSEPS
tara:strand:- start:380 stop:658 length:279 start_codon:yes stop_codon:yes gene_type:complete